MKVLIVHESGETEFTIPDSKKELVRLLLFEVSSGAQNTPRVSGDTLRGAE